MLSQRPDLTAETTEFLQRFRQFVDTHAVPKPVSLGRLPKRIDLTLFALPVRADNAGRALPRALDGEDPLQPLRRLRMMYHRHALLDPNLCYSDVIARLLARDPHTRDESADAAPSLVEAVQTQRRFFEQLTAAFGRYIETKDKTEEHVLLNTCYTLLAYDSHSGRIDERLIETLYKEPETYLRGDLQTIRERHCGKLARLKRSIAGPIVARQLEKAKRATARTSLKSGVRSNLIRHLNDAASPDKLPGIEALVERALKLYREHAPSKDVVRVQGIVRNALQKHRFIHSFFEHHFLQPEIDGLYALLHAPRQTRSPRKRGSTESADLAEKLVISLHPTKDYFDFLKAITSADCTWWPNLAGTHLLSPHFINVRMFRKRYWMGNVYLLDYSEEANTIVIDRIQLQDPEAFLPLRFFADFITRLVEELARAAPACRIIAAESISNSPLAQQSFFARTRGLARVSFAFAEADQHFECAQGRPLVVLHA